MIQIDPARVVKAIELISMDDEVRNRFIELCRESERILNLEETITREDITGVLVDTLMKDRVFQKKLADGTVFEMKYVAKISRDFILSPDPVPDHVWEPQTTKLLLHLASKARQVIVGGAYIGDQAILIAKKIKKHGGTCHVFEPDAHSFYFLKRNAALNELDNIEFNNLGLWNRETYIDLIGDDSHAYPKETTDHSAIRATSIREYALKKNIERIDLIMLDQEGGEFPSLKGANDFLRHPAEIAPNIIFEVHRHYVDWTKGLEATEIVDYVRSLGYLLYAIRDFQSNHPMRQKPVELIPLNTVYLEGPPHGFNLFGFKNKELLNDTLFKIVEGVSPKLLLHKDPKLHHPIDGL